MKWHHHASGYYYALAPGGHDYYYVVRLEVPGASGRLVWVWGHCSAHTFSPGRTVRSSWTREDTHRTATEAKMWAERSADADAMSSV